MPQAADIICAWSQDSPLNSKCIATTLSEHVRVGVCGSNTNCCIPTLYERGADGHISAAGKKDLNKLPTNESALKWVDYNNNIL